MGHVALGLEILERHTARLQGFPVELKSVLQHLIVSHHGELDKGTLKQPMLPEALAFSIMDLLDARLEQAWTLIDRGQTNEEWTTYVPSLGRQILAARRSGASVWWFTRCGPRFQLGVRHRIARCSQGGGTRGGLARAGRPWAFPMK